MLFVRQKFDKFLVLLVLAAVFCLLSYRPQVRISPQMPAEFVDVSNIDNNARQRIFEQRLAKAYWNCVVETIQWQYTYGSRLPQDPPQNFVPAGADLTTLDPTTRARYWRKLQEVWYMPTAWQKNYEWDTSWTTSWIDQAKSAGNWLYSRMSAVRF